MDLWTELAASVRLALSLWEHKEKNKYVDELDDLVKERADEMEKPLYLGEAGEIERPERYRDYATLDQLDRRLCQLRRTISATVGGKNAVP
jgi:hypothetical protein